MSGSTATTACNECRRLKARCLRTESNDPNTCNRCFRLGAECIVVPRKLGRKLGSRNRPKAGPSGSRPSTSTSPAISPRRQDVLPSNVLDDSVPASPMPLTPGVSARAEPHQSVLNVLYSGVAEATEASTSLQALASLSPISAAARPFDRDAFVAKFRPASHLIDEDPFLGASLLESGLDGLIEEPETEGGPADPIIHARIDLPRRESGPGLDPIALGIISESDAEAVYNQFWSRCHGSIRILDPAIHSMLFVRLASPFLLTAILHCTAQRLPASKHILDLVERLDCHMMSLWTLIISKGWQSIEIAQALIIWVTYLKGSQQHTTWSLTGLAILYLLELRVDYYSSSSTTVPWSTLEAQLHTGINQRAMRRNLQRTLLVVMEHDLRVAFIRGRQPILKGHIMSLSSHLREWISEPDARIFDADSAAWMSLRLQACIVQRQAQKALLGNQAESFDEHLSKVNAAIDGWTSELLPLVQTSSRARMVHEAQCLRFVLLMMHLDHHAESPAYEKATAREECLAAALGVCKLSLPLLRGDHPDLPLAGITAFSLYLMCYIGFSTLRIMDSHGAVAMRNGSRSDMDLDVFNLVILSLFANEIEKLPLHSSMASISAVLGRRLLSACRKLFKAWVQPSASAPVDSAIDQWWQTGSALGGIISSVPPPGTGQESSGEPIPPSQTFLSAQDLEFSFDGSLSGDLFSFLNDTGGDFGWVGETNG